MTTNPINIEFKEDSAEKLAKIVGQPTKYYIKAPEFNEVVNRLKTLWNLVQVNSTNIDSLILGENILDFTTASFIDEINAGPIITLSSAYFRVTVDGVVSIYAFTGVDGNYGSGALQVTEEQCLLLYTSGGNNPLPKFEFRGKLFQAGTAVPSANVLTNPHEITPIYSRISQGNYKINLDMINWTQAVDGQRIQFFLSGCVNNRLMTWQYDGAGVVDIQVRDMAGNYVDGLPANGIDFYFQEV